jgi:hypothetical protein
MQPFQERMLALPGHLKSILKVPSASTAGKILGGGALAHTAYHGLQDSSEQEARIRDLMNVRKQQLDAPMVPLSVKHSAEKTARDLYTNIMGTSHNALANAVARSLVERPLNAAGDALNKKLYTQPKQNKAFQHATTQDELVSKAYKDNPDQIHSAFSTMKRFGPSLAEDPNAVKSFLRQSSMANGQIDYATIRMLAETEKFIRHARGQGTGQ